MSAVAMLRVKNEARWIEEVLAALQPCCDRIFVMDDHSTDGTPDIARTRGAEVFLSPFGDLDEARDKDYLLRQIEKAIPAGAWVLCIDGDEVLEPCGPAKIEALTQQDGDAYAFRILYCWGDRAHVRVDRIYSRFMRPSMFRLRPGLAFQRTGIQANFHCSSVPAQCRYKSSDVVLLHLGYMHSEDRIRKYRWYNEIDPHNSIEDEYRHMVIGDLFPAESSFRWAGPLELRPI